MSKRMNSSSTSAVGRPSCADSTTAPVGSDHPVGSIPGAATRRLGTFPGDVKSRWVEHFSGIVECSPRNGNRWAFALLACVSAVLLFPDNRPLLDPDEGRHAEIARSMLARGDFLVPRLQDIPYYEKPPLQYWLTALAYQMFGVECWAARIVPAIAGWSTLLITFLWGRRALGWRVAFLGAMCLGLSLEFVVLGRTVVLDSMLTFFVTATSLAAHVALSNTGLRWRWWLIAAVSCGFGMLTKGPVALFLVLPSLWTFAWLTGARVSWRALGVFIIVAAAVAAPWYIAMSMREPAFLTHFLWKVHFLRFFDPFDHQQPWWFYVPVLFLGTFPWSLLWPGVVFLLVNRRRGFSLRRTPGLGYCALLAAWHVVFFSLSGCKSVPYLLPALVPLGLLTGACLEAVLYLPSARRFPLFGYARIALPCHASVAVLLLGTGTYIVAARFGWMSWSVVTVPVVVFSCLAVGCWLGRFRMQPNAAWGICAAACVAFGLLPCRKVYEAYSHHHSPLAVAERVRRMPANDDREVVSADRVWYSASFYLEHTVCAHHGENLYTNLDAHLARHSETVVLVRNDARLQLLGERLSARSFGYEYEVLHDDPQSHVAMVTIRRREPTLQTSTTSLVSDGSISGSDRRGFSQHNSIPSP